MRVACGSADRARKSRRSAVACSRVCVCVCVCARADRRVRPVRRCRQRGAGEVSARTCVVGKILFSRRCRLRAAGLTVHM